MSVLLRSGDIKNYSALGQDGQAVYTVAIPLKEAIRFKHKQGRKFAEYLAIPQRNDIGSKIDWYVPFDSNSSDGTYHIIPWTSATDEEKGNALVELDFFKSEMLEFGKNLVESDKLKGDQLLFSRLLYTPNASDSEQLKVIRFPNEEHIYLVNDRPVITFWGFIEKNQQPSPDPFLCLRKQEAVPIAPAVSSLTTTTPMIEERHNLCKRLWWLWLLLLALLAGLVFYYFKPYFFPENKTTESLSTTSKLVESNNKELKALECKNPVTYYLVNGVIRDKEGKIHLFSRECDIIVKDSSKFPYRLVDGKWVDVGNKPVNSKQILDNLSEIPDAKAIDAAKEIIKLEENKPVGNVDDLADKPVSSNSTDTKGNNGGDQAVMPPVDPTNIGKEGNNSQDSSIAGSNQNQTAMPESNKNLNLDPQALAQGKTDFLNGNWNAGAGIQDKATGKPLRMSYSFNNGQGQVTLERGDGITCSGNVNAASNGGGLNINNAGVAACTDGSSYQLPNVVCKPTASGQADCSGSYGSGGSFPMTMKTN